MKLFESEGLDLFEEVGINVPKRIVITSTKNIGEVSLDYPLMLKAQVLSGRRGKRGLVERVENGQSLERWLGKVLGKEIDGQVVGKILVQEWVEVEREIYLSITYSTKTRGSVLLLGDGGVEVEDRGEVVEVGLDIQSGILRLSGGAQTARDAQDDKLDLKSLSSLSNEAMGELEQVIGKLWGLFKEKDLFLAEINPLVLTKSGELVAVDAKVVSDDAANFRQKWDLPERNMLGLRKSWAELEAETIDADDHRGVVGRVYLDLPEGDIGVIAAGGGASLVAMDAMVAYGLSPANYTEFSGNPPADKVARLTEVVLARKGLRGAMLVGGKANFTDQYETLSGFVAGLKKINPPYPILVRRDGPRMDEAKKLLLDEANRNNWKLEVLDASVPIVEAVRRLSELVNSR